MAAMMMVTDVMPIVQEMVPRTVRPVGAEDHEELIQDVMASAASMLDAMERSGKPLMPRSVAFYAIQRAKTGRRSTYSGAADVLSAAADIQRGVAICSLDAPLEAENGMPGDDNLHDLLADHGEDPAQQAARQVDWSELMEDMSARDVELLRTTLSGGRLNALAKKCRVSSARLCQQRREIGAQVKVRWGEDALADAVREPRWLRGDLRCGQERDACRYDNGMASDV